jgi:hypothetical protein
MGLIEPAPGLAETVVPESRVCWPVIGPLDEGMINVRSVVDLRSASARSSFVSGRKRGLRLQPTHAQFLTHYYLFV